jgi:hypothetical protein
MNLGWENRCSDPASEILCYIGDDFEFVTPGWDDVVVAHMERTDYNTLVTGPDGYLGNIGCPTFFFVGAKIVDAIGEFVCPAYQRENTDVVWGQIMGQPLFLTWRLDELKMEHHHSTRPGHSSDETFNRLQAGANEGMGGGLQWDYVRKAQRAIIAMLKAEDSLIVSGANDL